MFDEIIHELYVRGLSHIQVDNHGIDLNMYIIYSTLISITIKISIKLNALSIPLWHSITFGVFLQIQGNSLNTMIAFLDDFF